MPSVCTILMWPCCLHHPACKLTYSDGLISIRFQFFLIIFSLTCLSISLRGRKQARSSTGWNKRLRYYNDLLSYAFIILEGTIYCRYMHTRHLLENIWSAMITTAFTFSFLINNIHPYLQSLTIMFFSLLLCNYQWSAHQRREQIWWSCHNGWPLLSLPTSVLLGANLGRHSQKLQRTQLGSLLVRTRIQASPAVSF